MFWPFRLCRFLSTLSLRRATHYDNYNLHCVEISIHALLAESDSEHWERLKSKTHFYPRSPCGERPSPDGSSGRQQEFLSTLSLRRATHGRYSLRRSASFLSTLSLRRATPNRRPCPRSKNFYPRSPCGERHCDTLSALAPKEFLSTLSLRRATNTADQEARKRLISIHALLAESDLLTLLMGAILITFLSTLSLRRATKIRFL